MPSAGRFKNRIVLFYGIFISSVLIAQTYDWPCQPFDEQHWINGTFCECRSGSSSDIDHFHDGVDIHLSEGGAVYSVINGTVTSIGTPEDWGINSWVRVDRYAYVHVISNPALSQGDYVTAFETVLGWTNSWNHIHFKDGWPGGEINALRNGGGLSPFSDPYSPTVNSITFHQSQSMSPFPNNRVSGTIDIVSRAMDHTDNGPYGANNGIFKIGIEILDSAGTTVYGPRMPYIFDEIPSNTFVTNVYAPGSSTSNYLYIMTNSVMNNQAINTANWDLGEYTARVFTWDTRNHADTLEQTFEVMETDVTPPSPPQLLSLMAEGNGFSLHWLSSPDEDLEGYRLYFSYDLERWTLSHDETDLPAGTTDLSIPSFSDNTPIFLKMTAMDNAPLPNESVSSSIFPLNRGNDRDVLFIDASSPSGGTSVLQDIAALGDRLGGDGYWMNSIHKQALDSTLIDVVSATDYSLIVVASGQSAEAWSDSLTATVASASEDMSTAIWIMGTHAMTGLSQSETGQSLMQTWGFVLDQLAEVPDLVTGTSTGIFNGLNATIYTENLGDSLDVASNNSSDFETNLTTSTNENVGYESLSGINPFLYSALPWSAFSAGDQHWMYHRAKDYFLPQLVTETENAVVPDRLLLSVYPNPFNSGTIVSISALAQPARLKLIDLLGRHIWSASVAPSKSEQHLRITAGEIQDLSSGLYFLQLADAQTNVSLLTTKLLYVK